jgi:hypothetical protein
MNNDTQISPGIGALPADFSAAGGIVVDLLGTNGNRITAQIPPSKLFKGSVPAGAPNWLSLAPCPALRPTSGGWAAALRSATSA